VKLGVRCYRPPRILYVEPRARGSRPIIKDYRVPKRELRQGETIEANGAEIKRAFRRAMKTYCLSNPTAVPQLWTSVVVAAAGPGGASSALAVRTHSAVDDSSAHSPVGLRQDYHGSGAFPYL